MRGGNEPEEQAEGRRDFMGGRFRNRRRGISTGREELTQPGSAEAVIRAGSRESAPQSVKHDQRMISHMVSAIKSRDHYMIVM